MSNDVPYFFWPWAKREEDECGAMDSAEDLYQPCNLVAGHERAGWPHAVAYTWKPRTD